ASSPRNSIATRRSLLRAIDATWIHRGIAVLCGAILSCITGGAAAQQYPVKVVRLIMPYPAGGSTDIVGRLVAERLSVSLGQTVLVDNRPGASTQIGTKA